jgi:hypothetical protein
MIEIYGTLPKTLESILEEVVYKQLKILMSSDYIAVLQLQALVKAPVSTSSPGLPC